VASYRDSARRLGNALAAVDNRVRMSPLHSDFFQFRLLDLGPFRKGPSPELSAVNLIAQEVTSPGGDARHHFFAVVMLDPSAAVAEAVLRGCRAHPALGDLPARWRGLAGTDDRTPGDRGPDDPTAAVQIVLAPDGSWDTQALALQLWRYANEVLDEFASGREQSLSSEGVSARQALARRLAEGPRDRRDEGGGTRPVGARPAGESKPTGYPPPSGMRPMAKPSQELTRRSRSDRPQSHRPHASRGGVVGTVASFFSRLARAMRGDGPLPRLAAVDGMVRLVLLVVVSDEGRPDPAEDRRGWSRLAKVERELARVEAGFWVRPLSVPGLPRDLLHPAGRRAHAERGPEGYGLNLAAALETARAVLDEDIAALKGGSWLVDRPAVVLYVSRVPLSDPRTVRAYGELRALRPVVSWVVPPGSADLIAPQLRADATVINDRRGIAGEVTRTVCEQLAGG
jgi:hypothetical protein